MTSPLYIDSSSWLLDKAQLQGLSEKTGATVIDARKVSLPEGAIVFSYNALGLGLIRTGTKELPVVVDFTGGKAGHRRQFGGGKGQDIAKAVGMNKGIQPSVLDATGGLGRDAFVLASLGCQLTIIERSPVIAALLEDGLRRGELNNDVAEIISRIQLIHGDAINTMHQIGSQDMTQMPIAKEKRFAPPQTMKKGEAKGFSRQSNLSSKTVDVVYLDPMFPHREKSALVKKEMRLFQDLVGADLDADQLLAPAQALAQHRVVVKRPRRAPDLASQPPTYRLEGKSCRYDIYVNKRFS